MLKKLREQRALTFEKLKAMHANAAEEGRELNEEDNGFDADWQAELDSLDKKIKRLEEIDAYAAKLATPAPAAIPGVSSPEGDSRSRPQVIHRYGALKAFLTPEGKPDEQRAYTAGQWVMGRMFGHAGGLRYIEEHGLENSPEYRALGSDWGPSGGNLVIPEFERAVIDIRQAAGVFRQNARVVPMGSDTLTVPRRASGLTAYFVGENSEITASDKGWDQVTLTARKLGCLCKYASELAEDAVINIADDLASEIGYAFAAKEDLCGFRGDGTSTYGGMIGVENRLAAGSIQGAASGTAFSSLVIGDFESMIGLLPDYTGINAKWYVHKAAWAASMLRLADALGGVTKSEALGLQAGPTFLGYPVVFVNSMFHTLTASASQAGAVFFGDLAMAATMGDRRGIRVKVSDQRYLEYDQWAVQGTERFDIVVHEIGASSTAGAIIGLTLHA